MSHTTAVLSKLKTKQVVLVNQDDEPIGQTSVWEAHQGNGLLHRACSVFLFNDLGQLLIQQRSPSKIVSANKWANTACGNVMPGEDYLGCALRRLKDELGITEVKLKPVGKFQYQVNFSEGFCENEIDTVFVGRYNAELEPNQEEVTVVKWIKFDELLQQLSNTQQKQEFAPWVEKILSQNNIKQALQQYV